MRASDLEPWPCPGCKRDREGQCLRNGLTEAIPHLPTQILLVCRNPECPESISVEGVN